MKSFSELSQSEILALAISSEEDDERTYRDFAEGLRAEHPDTAQIFSDMASEEIEHRRLLTDLYIAKFGSHIPSITRHDVRGFFTRQKLWHVRLSGIAAVRQHARQMEQDAARFYLQAAARAKDPEIRDLLN